MIKKYIIIKKLILFLINHYIFLIVFNMIVVYDPREFIYLFIYILILKLIKIK